MTNSKHFSDTNCTVCTLLVVIMAEAKIDLILEQLKALGPIQFALEGLRSSIQDVNEDVKNLQFDAANHDDRIRALERDMKEQKDIANSQQQHLRSLTLRLMNFPVSHDESADNNAGLKAKVYDIVLKPLLTAAKAAKDLSSVPQMATVLEACFRPFNAAANSNSDSGPPHVIIKVTTKVFKIALMKNRKHLPKSTIATDKALFLVEDLTPATHKLMVAISKARETDKTWTVDGNIKFTLTGKPTVFTVKSVYDPISVILNR